VPYVQCAMECILNKDNGNSGNQCPWKGTGHGLKCDPFGGCSGDNCMGETACVRGSCPPGSVGVFCRKSGAPSNYKLC
jgi:hypothetical protein